MILSRKNDQQRTERRLVTQGSESGGVGFTGMEIVIGNTCAKPL